MAEKTMIPNVLADRYASPEMVDIWSPRGRIRLERDFWIAVMKVQRELGADIPAAAIAAYEGVAGQIDVERIRKRELELRHDVKARIEEFCALAGYEHVHAGLTSRDLTENVEQLQIVRSLSLVRMKYAACLYRLAERASEYREVVLVARTHNVPAQPTTLGRRLAMFGEEMLEAWRALEQLVEDYPLRGIKGAVGTQADQIGLLGDAGKVKQIEERIAAFLGFNRVLGAVGQIYPRSLDVRVLSTVYQLGAGPAGLAKTLRLMAGLGLVSEGFRAGQVGSSAMPHKVNARSCERIGAFQAVLNGYLNMVMSLGGEQWNEGDVSCSVVRRVALPGAMFAIDGMMDTLLTVLRNLEVHLPAIAAECARHLPFIASGAVLTAAVRRGAKREQAHKAISEHALAVAGGGRAGEAAAEDLVERLAGDGRVGLERGELEDLLAGGRDLCGVAVVQVESFVRAAGAVAAAVRGAKTYQQPEIL